MVAEENSDFSFQRTDAVLFHYLGKICYTGNLMKFSSILYSSPSNDFSIKPKIPFRRTIVEVMFLISSYIYILIRNNSLDIYYSITKRIY